LQSWQPGTLGYASDAAGDIFEPAAKRPISCTSLIPAGFIEVMLNLPDGIKVFTNLLYMSRNTEIFLPVLHDP
jgi:hypothetical protein